MLPEALSVASVRVRRTLLQSKEARQGLLTRHRALPSSALPGPADWLNPPGCGLSRRRSWGSPSQSTAKLRQPPLFCHLFYLLRLPRLPVACSSMYVQHPAQRSLILAEPPGATIIQIMLFSGMKHQLCFQVPTGEICLPSNGTPPLLSDDKPRPVGRFQPPLIYLQDPTLLWGDSSPSLSSPLPSCLLRCRTLTERKEQLLQSCPTTVSRHTWMPSGLPAALPTLTPSAKTAKATASQKPQCSHMQPPLGWNKTAV